MAAFFAMGGYAAYVWPAYGVALLVLGGLTIATLRRLRSLIEEVAELEAQSPRRARRRNGETA